MQVSMDYKAKRPVATFSCSCGFVYSRMGPDKSIEDRYRIGRKKQFGDVWESKLREYLQEGTYTLRQVARMMQCDAKTILKFDQKWEIGCFHVQRSRKDDKSVQKTALEMGKELPCKEQRKFNKKQQDKKKKVHKNRVDWEKRDKRLLLSFRKAYKELCLSEKPVRITRTRLARKLKLEGSIDKIIDKLPLTKEFIDSVAENISEFQLRRCKWIIDKVIENREGIKMWKIQRAAGIRKLTFNVMVAELEVYINEKIKT